MRDAIAIVILSTVTHSGEWVGSKICWTWTWHKVKIWGYMVKLRYLYNESCGLRAQLRPLSCKHRHCDNQATSQAKNYFFIKRKFASNLSLCLHPPQWTANQTNQLNLYILRGLSVVLGFTSTCPEIHPSQSHLKHHGATSVFDVLFLPKNSQKIILC